MSTLAVLLTIFGVGRLWAQTTDTTFTSSGTFEVPASVTEITVELWGGGGSGSNANSGAGGGGGGGGGAYTRAVLTVTPGNSFTVTVGAGGSVVSNNPTAGGISSFVGTGFTTINANGGAAPSGTISGTIFNSDTGSPLSGVVVKNSSDASGTLTTVVDDVFSFNAPLSQTITIMPTLTNFDLIKSHK